MPIKSLDLAGLVVGRLTVLERTDPPRGRTKRDGAFWKCQCSCGKTHVALASALASGSTKSCGCGRMLHRAKR